MIDPIPWFIQAPAEHSAEVARTLAYQAIGGKEGIARAGDLTVQPLPVPGGAVQVLPGAAGILNRGSGGAGQAYIGRVATAENVSIAATGSGSGRSDLIVFRVSDPQYGGSQPEDEVNGPYIFLDVVSGVNSTVTRVQDVAGHEYDSAITLARIDIPASTGTITEPMITNLARVGNPLTEQALRTYSLLMDDTETLTASAEAGEVWPNASTNAWERVHVPEWASRVRVTAEWFGVEAAGNHRVAVWAQIGGYGQPEIVTQRTTLRFNPVFAVADDRPVPAAMRGTSQRVYPMARLMGTVPSASRPVLDAWSSVRMMFEFYEV